MLEGLQLQNSIDIETILVDANAEELQKSSSENYSNLSTNYSDAVARLNKQGANLIDRTTQNTYKQVVKHNKLQLVEWIASKI